MALALRDRAMALALRAARPLFLLRAPRSRRLTTAATRNLGIIAHIDAGKTTTTERMLLLAGVTRAAGEVDAGDTVTDYLEQEVERGITIQAAATSLSWRDAHISLIDTPGHVDFTVEVERAVRVLDGAALVVDAVAGAQAQTETVWRQAQQHGVPAVAFVNKMDRAGASFAAALASLEERLGLLPLPLQLPLRRRADGGFVGAVDLVAMEAMRWDGGGADARAGRGSRLEYARRALADGADADAADAELEAEAAEPAGGGAAAATLGEHARAAREALVEAVSELEPDGAVADAYLGGDEVGADALGEAVRRLTVAGRAVPALCGASLHGVGVEALLDAVVAYLPAPAERPTPELEAEGGAEAAEAAAAEAAVERRVDPSDGCAYSEAEFVDFYGGADEWAAAAPAAAAEGVAAAPPPLAAAAEGVALAFKVQHDAHTKKPIVWLRVYAGELAPAAALRNARTGDEERPRELLRIHGADATPLDAAPAGTICAATGLRGTRTGDTLLLNPAAGCERLRLRGVRAPRPVFFCAVEAASAAEQAALDAALARLRLEDPSVGVALDRTTGQQLLGGMGELHLEVVAQRLRSDFGLHVRTGAMRVAYREGLHSSAVRTSTHATASFSSAAAAAASERAQADQKQIEITLSLEEVATAAAAADGAAAAAAEEEGRLALGGAAGGEVRCGAVAAVRERLTRRELRAVVEGLQAAAQHGDLLGFPLLGARATLLSVRRPRGATVEALRSAAADAMAAAMEGAELRIHEPVMRVELRAPEHHVGAVLSELSGARRGAVLELTAPPAERAGADARHAVVAAVPLERLIGYADALRSLTQGEASLAMEFSHYAPLDAFAQQQLLLELRGY